jgi:parallel beta-helix repeat protein
MEVLVIEFPRSPSLPAYTVHQPINITSDSDFVDQGWPGLGTSETPYIIEGLNITTSITSILIANTTRHFEIRDCWLSASGVVWGDGIITFDNVTHGSIENSVLIGVHSAITVYDSSNCSFTENAIGTQVLGLLAYNLNESIFSSNIQSEPAIEYPIHVQRANRLVIGNNTFDSVSRDGVRLSFGIDCIFEDNRFYIHGVPYLGQFGLVYRESQNCIMRGNVMDGFDSGLEVLYGSDNQVYNNTLTSLWTGILLRTTNALISDNMIRTEHLGIDVQVSNSCTIELNEIDGIQASSIGIESRVAQNTLIRWNELHSLDVAIQLQGGVDDRILENYVYDCMTAVSLEEFPGIGYEVGPPVGAIIANNTFVDCGFSFTLSEPSGFNHEITGNTINGGLLGYFFNESNIIIDGANYEQVILAACSDAVVFGGDLSGLTLMYCSGCEIVGVNVSFSIWGIHILQSSDCLQSYIEGVNNDVAVNIDRSESCSVYRSHFYDNGYGILLDESPRSRVYGCDIYDNSYGIVLIGAHDSNIETNSIHHNQHGIFILRTNDTLVGNNEVLHNWQMGIYLNRLSNWNYIIGNSFGWNGINAACTGTKNSWDNGIGIGNRWSDFSSADNIYFIDDDDKDRFPSLLGESAPTSTTTGLENNTMTKGLFDLSTQQVTVASVLIGSIVILFTVIQTRRKLGR